MATRKLFTEESERQQQIADRLLQQAIQPRVPQQTGRIATEFGWGEGLAQLGEALLARRAQRRADDARHKEETRDRAAFGLPPNQQPQRRAGWRQRMQARMLAGQPAEMSPEDQAEASLEQEKRWALFRGITGQMSEEESEFRRKGNGMAAQLESVQRRLPTLGLDPELAYQFYRDDPEGYRKAVLESQQPVALSAGAKLYDRSGREIASNPAVETGGNSRYGSPQLTESNKIIALDRATGRYVYTDSGKPWNADQDPARADIQLREREDGSLIAVDTGRGIGRGGPRSEEVVPPDTEAPQRAGNVAEAEARARERVKVETEAQSDIASLDESIRKTQEVLNRFRRGDFSTGPVRGRLPAVTTADQELESFIGEDVLQRISSATFGALSEGERGFLRSSGMNRENTEAANIGILERRLTSLENAKRAAQRRLSGAGVGESQPSGGMDFSQLSDDDLRRLIGGQ